MRHILSVAVSAVVGYVMLLALTNSIPPNPIADTANDPYGVCFAFGRDRGFPGSALVNVVSTRW